ncbi:hypothetical protein [Trueperella pecoris]|uniref:hypothetical protein n=1 Tax=Trueperella pecoris TaxID=2733571 RepID=UPI00186BA4A6|nr:hypothetical protein [Trueperella pecoris]QOQ38601.1 hypothetical protein HLG82_03475 [Trueperella pecoris]QTG74816.1 hypothetical protein J4179_06140 [Trueperella pecoris]
MNEQGESLLEILDELMEIVAHAKSLPMSASVMVNRSELLDLIETARDIVPDQIVAADSVLQEASAVSENARQEAETIRARAEKDADTILAEAREQASRLVAQDQVTIAAKSQATRILDEAQAKADSLKRGADDYAATTLDQLSEELGGLLEQIAAGRAHLAHRLEDA